MYKSEVEFCTFAKNRYLLLEPWHDESIRVAKNDVVRRPRLLPHQSWEVDDHSAHGATGLQLREQGLCESKSRGSTLLAADGRAAEPWRGVIAVHTLSEHVELLLFS